MTELNVRGDFHQLNDSFIKEYYGLQKQMDSLISSDKEIAKKAMDNIGNLINDSYIGKMFGFDEVNYGKHGFDARNSKDGSFFESKVASWTSHSIGATFNDTNLEKADMFKRDDVFLGLSVWNHSYTPLFIAFGNNSEIGNWLEEKVKKFLSGNGGVRSTQSISLKKLITEYGFSVYVPKTQIDEFKELALPRFKFIKDYKIIEQY